MREPFERGLRDLGWAPGSTVAIEQRYADGKPDLLRILAAELVQIRVDVIVAHGTAAVRAVRQATSTIPIVMSATGSDPVRDGLVQSLRRPGGNVTGLTVYAQETLEPKQLELLERSGVRAVLVRADPLVLDAHSRQSVALALKHRLPAIYPWPPIPASGGLMSYNTKLEDLHRRSAFYVDRILKGAKPGDLPVEQPTTYELVINLKTARTLGLSIPPALLLRADRVIE